MRKALIGTSSPIGYDYKYSAPKVKSDTSSSPNPILESSFGLFLLYDEIWFWCRSFCPVNMRDLDYVKFVDEEYEIEAHLPTDSDLLSTIIIEEIEGLKSNIGNVAGFKEGIFAYDMPEAMKEISYEEWKRAHGIFWDSGPDNHTHTINIGHIGVYGNATPNCLLFDLALMNSLGLTGFELVTNSYTHGLLCSIHLSNKNDVELIEYLVIDYIPNYLTKYGPYHPVLDEARGNQYLTDFRNWIVNNSSYNSRAELAEVKNSVERSILEIQNNLFLKYLDTKTHYKSIGKSAIGDVVGLFVPGAATVGSIVENRLEKKKIDLIKWQGFLVSMRKHGA